MQYHQVVAGLRPDVTVVNVFFADLPTLVTLVHHQLAAGRPVYSTYQAPALAERFVLYASALRSVQTQ